MKKRIPPATILAILAVAAFPTTSGAQQHRQAPPIEELIERFDKDGDGQLTKAELADTRMSRVFKAWDADGNGEVTASEIEAFRAKRRAPDSRPEPDGGTELHIPDLDQVVRGRTCRRPKRERPCSTPVDGDTYIILTDHREAAYLEPLQALADHRKGMIIRSEDLSQIYKDAKEMERLRAELTKQKVCHIAIAPRLASYRENMVLGMWELLSTLDDDPQLDAFPGFLLASGEKEFAALIDRAIDHEPLGPDDFHPFAISQVPSAKELRSLEKAGVFRKWFAEHGHETPTVGIYSPSAKGAPDLPGDDFWRHDIAGRRDFLKAVPEAASAEFEKASLLVMHGHGIPGMSCGVDIEALPDRSAPGVVICGSCFSAAPPKSDLPKMGQAPGGYEVKSRDAFTIRAIDRGTDVTFGHMRLSRGFPHLFPVLESWLAGNTVGEGYQGLINTLLEQQNLAPGEFAITENAAGGRRQPPQNLLLYIVIGDPALRPFDNLIKE